MIRILVFALLLIGGTEAIPAQNPNLGIPFIHSYPKDVYQSGAQNWDIAQDSHGVMYFANNNGLMYYDGSLWKTFPLPNATIVRSVAISSQEEIYVGGQNEFGKFVPDHKGTLTFESLKDIIPEAHQGFEDVWDIVIIDEGTFFRASNKLYRIYEGQCTVYDGQDIIFLGVIDGRVVVQDLGLGLLYFEKNELKKLAGSEVLKNKLISNIVSSDQTSIIATQDHGLFLVNGGDIQAWETDADDFLKQNHITTASKAKNGTLALGTDFGGVLIMDSYGKSQFHVDRSNSLLNDKVFSTFYDKSQNLWLGVDNGINYIELNSPFTRIYPDGGLEGAGFAAKVFDDKIYFGTSNGLYVTEWNSYYEPLNPAGFELVGNTKGQNWSLDIEEDELLLGHNNGVYSVKGKNAELIYTETGAWNFETLNRNPDFAIAGTYKNFAVFKKEAEKWAFVNGFDNWSESSRFVEQDQQGNIWMAHPYKGIFKIQLKEGYKKLDVKKYGAASGLPSDIQNHLFKIKEEIIFCGEHGIYLYNEGKDLFEPYVRFNDIFGAENKIRRLVEAANGDIWFITKEEIGILKIEDRGLDKMISKQIFPDFKNQLNPGFESIYPYDDKNVFITNDKGFIHYNPSFQNQGDSTFEVILNEVRLTMGTDSLIFEGYRTTTAVPIFNADENALQFNFSGTDYAGKQHLKYRFFLEGFDDDWQDWSTLNRKEYTNLSPGKYKFSVQAKNQRNVISSITEYNFEILAPWYASRLAYLIYGLLTLILIGGIIRAYRKKYYGLKEDRDQTIKNSKEVIGKLEKEKTQAELEYKQRELASTAMHVVQKNETLGKIKEQLLDLKKLNKDTNVSKEIQKMINMLQQDEIIDDGWEQFMFHFNQLHGDFYNRLKSEFTELTPKDLKMCTYLRMNLSTKEMASLLNVTTRGIEASRYRLRKKIRLEKDDNLTEFLMRF